jgi:hypothetical protein
VRDGKKKRKSEEAGSITAKKEKKNENPGKIKFI